MNLRRRKELAELRKAERDRKAADRGPAERVLSGTSPIAAAVEPTRRASVERAREFARDLAESTLEHLERDPSIALYPRSFGVPRSEYKTKKSLYTRVMRLTSDEPGRLSIQERRRIRDPQKLETFIDDAGDVADAQFTAFIQKLEEKIGPCVSATLTGDHVWGYSLLSVVKADGSKEVWKTQQIVNVSRLGTPFNQWPTRKVKS